VSDEERDSSEGLVSLLAGIGVGVIIGGMAALLLAPQAGHQTREQIRGSADDALGRLRDSMDDLRVKVEELAGNAREQMARRNTPGALQGDVAGATDEGSGAA
jgi:gas vesicle protein